MEAEKEDTTNIELFQTLFNEVLQKVSGHKEYKFNPLGWCTDMAVANFAALIIVFGEEAASRIKSCEFHFKDQRNKKALTITPAYLTSSEKILYSQVKFTQEENLLDQILIKLYSYVLDSF